MINSIQFTKKIQSKTKYVQLTATHTFRQHKLNNWSKNYNYLQAKHTIEWSNTVL